MSKDILRTKADLKARWISANHRWQDLRGKVVEAEKEVIALQRALDALEKAAPDLDESEPTSSRSQTGTTIMMLTEVLKARGPMTAHHLAEATGISYWTVNANLRKGPFQAAGNVKEGRRAVQTWKVAKTDTTEKDPDSGANP